MRLLIDTHVAIWWLRDPRLLSASARDAIRDGRNDVFVSAASVWEIGLKVAKKKLRVPDGYLRALEKDGFSSLDIRPVHAERAPQLPDHHADPFDRLLIAQALCENLVFVTRDDALMEYGAPLLLA